MKIAVRAASYMVVSGMLAAGSIGACSSDDSSNGGGGGGNGDSGTTPSADAGGGGGNPDTGTVTPPADSSTGADTSVPVDSGKGVDSSPGVDANGGDASDASIVDSAPGVDSALPQTFCQKQTGLDFCQDFDDADPLSLDAGSGASGFWSQTVGSSAELALSTVQAASAPSSLLVQLADGAVNGDRSAKVVKMLSPAAGVSQAIYEFDMYIATVPLVNTGGFATDFQFVDNSGGSDLFGFRIGVFSNATGFDHADLEHNHPVLGGNDDITSPIGLTAGAWNHVKMVVAFSALANDAGNNVAFQLYLNKSANADVNANYPAPASKAAFARFAAGMVFAFDGTHKDWGIYYDNFTLKIQ